MDHIEYIHIHCAYRIYQNVSVDITRIELVGGSPICLWRASLSLPTLVLFSIFTVCGRRSFFAHAKAATSKLKSCIRRRCFRFQWRFLCSSTAAAARWAGRELSRWLRPRRRMGCKNLWFWGKGRGRDKLFRVIKYGGCEHRGRPAGCS